MKKHKKYARSLTKGLVDFFPVLFDFALVGFRVGVKNGAFVGREVEKLLIGEMEGLTDGENDGFMVGENVGGIGL